MGAFVLFFFSLFVSRNSAKVAHSILCFIKALPTFYLYAVSMFIGKEFGEYLCVIAMCATIYSV